LSASYAKTPFVNVVAPQVAVTAVVGIAELALNNLAPVPTLQIAVHPPAKALAAVNEKKTACPSIFLESGVEVAAHSVISAIANVDDVPESCATTLSFYVVDLSPLYVVESPANFLSSVTGKLNLVNFYIKSPLVSPFP